MFTYYEESSTILFISSLPKLLRRAPHCSLVISVCLFFVGDDMIDINCIDIFGRHCPNLSQSGITTNDLNEYYYTTYKTRFCFQKMVN